METIIHPSAKLLVPLFYEGPEALWMIAETLNQNRDHLDLSSTEWGILFNRAVAWPEHLPYIAWLVPIPLISSYYEDQVLDIQDELNAMIMNRHNVYILLVARARSTILTLIPSELLQLLLAFMIGEEPKRFDNILEDYDSVY